MKKQWLVVIAIIATVISLIPTISDNSESTDKTTSIEIRYESDRNVLGETAAAFLRRR